MKPSLILQPTHQSSADILKSFTDGKPLSPDQLHFLDWQQKQLSSAQFDPVLKYYLQFNKMHTEKHRGSFLLHDEIINHEAIQKLKERIKLFLQQKAKVAIPLNQNQFLKFLELTMNELIFWHGNQLLTGAPMYPGGIPPVIFLQWGNYFGIVKYLVLSGEKALKANLMIYFQDMQERNLEQCVAGYQLQLEQERKAQDKVLLQHKLEPSAYQHFLVKRPTPFNTQIF
ncbi:MAG: hypothetical protein ACYCQI_00175 [Gammaproteobacteria bacterium]